MEGGSLRFSQNMEGGTHIWQKTEGDIYFVLKFREK